MSMIPPPPVDPGDPLDPVRPVDPLDPAARVDPLAPAEVPVVVEDDPATSIYRQWWFWVVLALLAIGVGALIAVATSGGHHDDATAATGGTPLPNPTTATVPLPETTAVTVAPTTSADQTTTSLVATTAAAPPTTIPLPVTTAAPAPKPTAPPPSVTATTQPPAPTTSAPPQPVVVEGDGTATVALQKPVPGPAIATITASGTGPLKITGVDAQGQPVAVLVDVATLPYSGTVPIDFGPGQSTASLQVTTSGHWRIEIAEAARARQFDGQATGTGDDVLSYTGQAAQEPVRFDGPGHFVLAWYPAGGGAAQVLADRTGAFTGTVQLPGPGLVVVKADGSWSIG
jgi:hypothetical protein